MNKIDIKPFLEEFNEELEGLSSEYFEFDDEILFVMQDIRSLNLHDITTTSSEFEVYINKLTTFKKLIEIHLKIKSEEFIEKISDFIKKMEELK